MTQVLAAIYPTAMDDAGTDFTQSIAIGSGANRVGVVWISIAVGAGAGWIGTVSIGSVTLTAINSNLTGPPTQMRAYQYAGDVSGISGSQTLTVQNNGGGGASYNCNVAVHVEDGVDGWENAATNAATEAAGTALTSSVTVTSTTSDVVVAFHTANDLGITGTGSTVTNATETDEDFTYTNPYSCTMRAAGAASIATSVAWLPTPSTFGLDWAALGISLTGTGGSTQPPRTYYFNRRRRL